MWTKNNRLKCDICGKFISYRQKYYRWTPYGGALDLEPPDEEHAHEQCFKNQNKSSKSFLERATWIKPALY